VTDTAAANAIKLNLFIYLIALADAMVIKFGVTKLGCGESVGLVPYSAKYLKFSRQRDPHGLTHGLTHAHTLASRGLEEPFFISSCAVVSVFCSGGK
jgi:hypothetical protein